MMMNMQFNNPNRFMRPPREDMIEYSKSKDNSEDNSGAFKWRSMVDNFCIEVLSSTVINLTSIFCYDYSGDNFPFQFIPALIVGLLMMGLKDEDYYFPDASPLVTLLMWAIGGYSSWIQAAARLAGHLVGFFLSFWICNVAILPKLVIHHVLQPASMLFTLEAIMTCVEHLAVVYVIVPLLPSPGPNSNSIAWSFSRVRNKNHRENTPPSNKLIMHAAFVFVLIHWCMWRTFETEINPSTVILMAYIRDKQRSIYTNATLDGFSHKYAGVDIWGRCAMSLWGEMVGLGVCIVYTLLFIPRESKIWHAKSS